MESLKNKKLLILAGNAVHRKLVRAAKALGVYTIVTDYLSPEESPAKYEADEYWMISTGDTEALAQKCIVEHVEGVLAFAIDTVQYHYLWLCERLNLPCYGTKRQFDIMTNKRLFKDFCVENGVDVIPEYTLQDAEEGKIKYPVLVKPTDSRGSRGQTICYGYEDLMAAIDVAAAESKDGGYLIERYMAGAHDMALAYTVINKTPYLVKICDRYVGTHEDRLDRQQIASILPSNYTDTYIAAIGPKVEKMITALDMSFGPVTLQGFIEGERMYMYDPGLRFPGTDFDVVLKKATGFDLMSSYVHFALTGDIGSCYGNPIHSFRYGGKVCLIMSVAARAGKLCSMKGLDELSRREDVLSVSLYHLIGDQIPASGDIRQRVVEFCCLLPDKMAVKEFIKTVYNTLKIEDEDGRDMIISKLKTDVQY